MTPEGSLALRQFLGMVAEHPISDYGANGADLGTKNLVYRAALRLAELTHGGEPTDADRDIAGQLLAAITEPTPVMVAEMEACEIDSMAERFRRAMGKALNEAGRWA